MKYIYIIIFVIISVKTTAQVFPVSPVYISGDDDKRINIVVLSDGYQVSELPQFLLDVKSFSDALFLESPYSEYKNYFNVYAIQVPSNESGASHPGTATDVTEPDHPVSVVDNYFGSTFDFFNIHRLLYAVEETKITDVLADSYPNYDVVVVMANTPYYGGSGGDYITLPTNTSANDIGIHEMGHSFADLRDEYWAGDIYARESTNLTQETDPILVRWRNWVGENGVSIYQHSGSGNASNWYRPHQNCRMRALSNSYCSVCKEGTIEMIHAFVQPIDSYTPDNSTTIDLSTDIDFEITTVNPIPNTLTTNWELNGTGIGVDVNSVTLSNSDLVSGLNSLEVTVEDNSTYLRVDDHNTVHLYSVIWTINQATLSVDNITTSELEIGIYPNPSSDVVNIEFSGTSDVIEVIVVNQNGQTILQEKLKSSNATNLDISNLASGVYYLKLKLANGQELTKRLVKN